MNETEIKNNEKIINLVSKYFSLEKESLDYFINEINNPTIDPFYKEILKDSTDLRLRFKLGYEFMESVDEGWRTFKSYFTSFVREYKITYKDFSNNKVKLEKNEYKIQKAILIEKPKINQCPISGWCTCNPEKDCYKEAVEKIFSKINNGKLPKNGAELVISLNFADWFLCSTAESWGSCLDLVNGGFWTGLPGLIGDKNRCMIYITSGKKKKKFDIEVDSIISRSWALIDKENVINILHWYPNRLIEISKMKEITGLNMIRTDSGFKSKSKVHFMWHTNGITTSVYNDNTAPRKDGYIHSGYCGAYHFDKNFKETEDPFCDLEVGLADLIEGKETLENYFREDEFVCCECGDSLEEDEVFSSDERGDSYCESCYSEIFFECDNCGRETRGEGIETSNGDLICTSCYDDKYAECDDCGKIHDRDDMHDIRDEFYVCGKCYKNYSACHECKDEYHDDDMIENNGRFLCEGCR
jgi:hypothetical protein